MQTLTLGAREANFSFYAYIIVCRRRGWFYVGKGRDDQWWNSYKKYRGVDWKLLVCGVTEPEAHGVETAVIAALRLLGFKLYNIVDGGEGVSGYHHTEVSKAKSSASHKTRWESPELVADQLAIVTSKEFREQQSEVQKEVQNRPEVAEKKRAKRLELLATTDLRERLTTANRLLGQRPEQREKMREARSLDREKRVEGVRRAMANPEVKERHRASMIAANCNRGTRVSEKALNFMRDFILSA